ncbi:MAG: succinate dehydrogenase assembly factor 2 [Roseobacter sp.]
MAELHEHRIKRLKMRSMRRGIKEMDLILQRFAEAHLESMSDADLTLYDEMLSENDHDLYQWVTGQTSAPETYGGLVDAIVKDLPETSQ